MPIRSFLIPLAVAARAVPLAAQSIAPANDPSLGPSLGQVSPYLTIAQNVARGPEFSTLSAALTAAGLDHALGAAESFTLFAPTNAGFARLPQDMAARLMRPENRTLLAYILRNHVIAGRIDAGELTRRIRAQGGAARLETLSGQALTARLQGTTIVLEDANGNSARVIAPAQTQANGMLMAVDGLLLPKPGS